MTFHLHFPAPLLRRSSVVPIRSVVPKPPVVSTSVPHHCLAAVALSRASNVRCVPRDLHKARSPSAHRHTARHSVVPPFCRSLPSSTCFSSAQSVMAEIKFWHGKKSEYSLLAQSDNFLFPSPFFPSRLFTSPVIPNLSPSPNFLRFRLMD
jgi:hypothetical protein